jgi:hypothetical protein
MYPVCTDVAQSIPQNIAEGATATATITITKVTIRSGAHSSARYAISAPAM